MSAPARPPAGGSLPVYAMFAASGAGALVYQVLWSRTLGLAFGNTTASVSVVLGCFMTGLALGSFAAGRLVPRLANPMRGYAAAELGIGLFAVAFPFLYRLVDRAFPALAGGDASPAWGLAVRAALSFLLLTFPTTLMGATLPLLTEHFRRNPARAASFRAGMLYAANTLGAALGVVAGTFVLIELLGVFRTTMAAASLNFAVAAAGYLLSRRAGGEGVPAAPEAAPPPPAAAAEGDGEAGRREAFDGRAATAVLAASGATALASEVLWTRTLESLVGTSAYAFGTIVLLYLVGIAAGSWLMSLALPRIGGRRSLWLGGLQLAMGAWTIAALRLTGLLAEGIAARQGEVVPLSSIFGAYLEAMAILVPLSLLSGACFPVAARMIEPGEGDPHGASIARAYGWNTAGAVAGSLAAGFVVAPRFELFDALYVVALAYALTAAALFAAEALRGGAPDRGRRLVPAAAASLAVAAVAAAGLAGESTFVRHLKGKELTVAVPFHRPGLQGVVTVVKHRGWSGAEDQLLDALLVNGVGMTVKVVDTKMMAHLPLFLHPDPQDTLVICFGMGTTYRSAVSHGGNVTAVELVPEVYDAFPHFYADAARVLAYPKGRLVVNDGRNFLKLTDRSFDVITLDPPPPIDGAGVVNLYSREFIELAKSRLKKGGILAHWVPLPGSKAGVDSWDEFNALVNTFVRSFPYVCGTKGPDSVGLHLLGSLEPILPDGARIAARYAEPAVAADLREWELVPPSFFAGVQDYREGRVEGLRLLTDDDPWLEFYLLRTLGAGGRKTYPVSYW